MIVTQSLIKAFDAYLKGQMCGEYFKRVYITKEVKTVASKAMRLGNYFEQHALDMEKTEEPQTLKNGNLSKEFTVAEQQAANYKRDIGLQPDGVQQYLQVGDFAGTLDAIYDNVIYDLKYSGLLGNKWDGWHEDSLQHHWDKMIQAVHYSWLFRELKEKPKFIFAVYSPVSPSGSDYDPTKLNREWFLINIDDEVLNRHGAYLDSIRQQLMREIELDLWQPRPSLKACAKCPHINCEFRTDKPTIVKIDYSGEA